MGAPLRKIVHSTTPIWRSGSMRGLVSLSTFECAHQDYTKASERRRGCAYCFDCFYGKKQSSQALITLEQLNLLPVVGD